IDGILADAGVELLQSTNLIGEGEAFVGFALIGLLDLFLEQLNLLVQRLEDLTDAVTVADREAAALVLENIVGEGLELKGHALTSIVEQGQFLGILPSLLL